MNEKEFLKRIEKISTLEAITIPIYYTLDEEDNVMLDTDSMSEEFSEKLGEIIEIVNT